MEAAAALRNQMDAGMAAERAERMRHRSLLAQFDCSDDDDDEMEDSRMPDANEQRLHTATATPPAAQGGKVASAASAERLSQLSHGARRQSRGFDESFDCASSDSAQDEEEEVTCTNSSSSDAVVEEHPQLSISSLGAIDSILSKRQWAVPDSPGSACGADEAYEKRRTRTRRRNAAPHACDARPRCLPLCARSPPVFLAPLQTAPPLSGTDRRCLPKV